MRYPVIIALASSLAAVHPASAQTGEGDPAQDRQPVAPDRTGLRIEAGPGIVVAPRYPGADTYRVLPLPSIDIRYGNVFLNRDGLGVSLVDQGPQGWQVGVAAFVDFNRRERDDPVRLRGLGNIDTALQGRIFVGKGMGPFVARATLAHDFGATNGTTLDLSAGIRSIIGQRVMVFAGPGISIADDRYMQGFFGVTPAQAARGARSAYDVSAGPYKIGLNAGASVFLGRHWTAGTFASFGYLVGDAGRSPVIAQREQPAGGIVLSHRF